jgi:hypothetical protein
MKGSILTHPLICHTSVTAAVLPTTRNLLPRTAPGPTTILVLAHHSHNPCGLPQRQHNPPIAPHIARPHGPRPATAPSLRIRPPSYLLQTQFAAAQNHGCQETPWFSGCNQITHFAPRAAQHTTQTLPDLTALHPDYRTHPVQEIIGEDIGKELQLSQVSCMWPQ